ncbi:hypothetical protein [Chitinimonas sp. BJYL2]|uniref:DUF7793 family protein n=1 Tax=Chitinimonas sp. BJYL2 TaxID=2976696 RepID=UPI0022B5A489|nr:hypothetical protein [Chitinimonas sp. BJYL2]
MNFNEVMQRIIPPKVWLGDDGILRVDYGYRPRIDEASMRSALEQHLAIGVYPVPVMIFGQGVMAGTTEAEVFGSGPEICEVTLAVGMVMSNALAMQAAKLYLRFRHPPYPCQAFSREAEALAWLRGFLRPPETITLQAQNQA